MPAKKSKAPKRAAPKARAPRKPALPKLADGETYVGITLHDDRPHHLILLPGDEKLAWQKARDWAKAQGGTLPSRIDGLVLLKYAKAQFQPTAYWTDEQLAGDPACAWVRSFDWGTQDFGHVDDDWRCRAVRRVPIR